MSTFDLNKPYCFYFNEIAKIPHGSYNEKAISDYIVEFAKKRNLNYVQDSMNNVVIYKKASKGYENAKPLLLQAHMDMVCEANKSANFDFRKDSLKLKVEGEWLTAEGTTLGADDGTGVAYMLAILDDDSLEHPDLECCFTVQEEVGLFGALGLDTSLFKARRMVCLDGGGEISTGISSAGGCIVESDIDISFMDNNKPAYKMLVTGLSGGHSGGEIHKEKGNANRIAVRIMKEMSMAGVDMNLVSVNGGLKDNAIPRECEIIFTSNSDKELIDEKLALSVKNIRTELEFSDAGIVCTVEKADTVDKCMDDKTTKTVIDYLFLIPNGFRHKSMAIEGLTLTSLNTGIIKTEGDKVVVTSSIRSAIDSGIQHLIDTIYTLASLFDIKCSTSARYPGWNYKAESEMREKLNKIIIKNRGRELECMAFHGGCECGVFAAISEEMDILTYGPVSENVHTPDERLNLDSFDRSYKILCDLIGECK
ncbi:MAG: beta-Ala-His dipeptidase [Erysipelotrichaceae bacterium]|nr:beta-Ala-His dipeptidase [Erysipelotrichaceae bacterium]